MLSRVHLLGASYAIDAYGEGMTDASLDSIIAYCAEAGRVCPVPPRWYELWEMLPDRRRRVGGGWEPPAPLILGAWWNTSVVEKRDRLREHILWSSSHGSLADVEAFLRTLPEGDWLHVDG